jgi:hypothetical protein
MPPDDINVLTVDVSVLTLEKARQVANEIRRTRVGGGVDRAYWPWVIETLAAEVEAVCKQKEALRKELEWLRTKTVRGELDVVRAEKIQ